MTVLYRVSLFVCPASVPVMFACHPWFVIEKDGIVSRWEVFLHPENIATSWGHLHKDFYTPQQGINVFFFSQKYLWHHVRCIGATEGREGSTAARMAAHIENSPEQYPYRYQYSLLGPNSNTYVQWVLDAFPDSGLHLPWNALGKGGGIATRPSKL